VPGSIRGRAAAQRAALAEVLGEYGTTCVQTEYSATLGGIKEAAKKKLAAEGEARGIQRLADKAYAALEKVGGLKSSTWEKPEIIPASKERDST
jgi:hypothetical protein